MRPFPALPGALTLSAKDLTRNNERALGDFARARLPGAIEEPAMFVLKHLWAGLFGGILMVAIFVTSRIWNPDWALPRYDLLLAIAILTQVAFLLLDLESREEGIALVAYCLLGLGLELYNTDAGNWAYPEAGHFVIGKVPVFVTFLYASVGICVLRMIRIFDMRFTPFPPLWLAGALAALIYVNFFTQHLIADIRWVLFGAIVLLFARTHIYFRVAGRICWMPMLLSLFLSALGVWFAENLGTLTGTWLYEGQEPHETVSVATLGSWVLFLTVALMTALAVLPNAIGSRAER